MSIQIYKDAAANAIIFENESGGQFLNTLQATTDGTTVSVEDLARSIQIVTDGPYTEFVDENFVAWGSDAVSTTNNLNAIFQTAGSGAFNAPVITSSLTAAIVEGETLNYELTADYGVGYEWADLPAGVTTVEGNVRKLIGGSSVSTGTYNITMKAINYFGEDTETLVLTVSNPPFADTKSIKFVTNDYMDSADPSALLTVLGRTGNGAGSGDAWSISMWLKQGTHGGGGKQTMFFFGDTDYDNGGHIWLYHKANDDAVILEYGSKNNKLQFTTVDDAIAPNTWHHILVTYDGGTTGSSSGDIADYYSRFEMYIDGVAQSGTWDEDESNYGWSAAIDADELYFGRRRPNNDYMKNGCKLNEIAIWASDQSANVASIYNGGATQDLSSLGTAPAHWWRMGDGDTFPTILDNVGSVDMTMNNMTAADIVSDVP